MRWPWHRSRRLSTTQKEDCPILTAATSTRAANWRERCPSPLSPPLARLPQFAQKRQCFRGFHGESFRYIFCWIIFEGSLRRSFFSRIRWSSRHHVSGFPTRRFSKFRLKNTADNFPPTTDFDTSGAVGLATSSP